MSDRDHHHLGSLSADAIAAAKLQCSSCRTLLHAYTGRRATPVGISPVVTSRQNAISSLRAKATIIVLRVPPRPSAVLAQNQCASALSFWNWRNRQANRIMR
ncbi:MAG: hypothetical protein EOQ64_14050 [Mesorhizobium sp.]|nr:MAG: hypothetical protein EOQ64_14050 [Mesorhizobium sp.]